MKYRHENFGGIVAGEDPPFLAFVDRAFMREMGAGESPAWETEDESIGLLSAPTEVHLAATNACPGECPHCYMGAGARDAGEMDTAAFKRALDALAEMGVFHIALGGGEALARPDLFELAAHTRARGMVPNLTVSGALMTAETAGRMKVFGQVNLSLDGVGAQSGVFRGRDVSAQVDGAIDLLRAAGVPTGINCVIGRRNFDGLGALFDYAAGKGLNEVECLRLKPSGRAAEMFLRERMTHEQNVALLPRLQELSAASGVRAKIDCSFIPMLCRHNPPRELLEGLATYGCEAGNVLVGIRSDGQVSGCSFLPPDGLSVFELEGRWTAHPPFDRLRSWRTRAPEPCASCPYVDLCNGGCHAVALRVCGDLDAPDPDCPRVVEHRAASPQS